MSTRLIAIGSMILVFGLLGFVQTKADTLVCNLPQVNGNDAVFQGHIMVLDNDNKSFTFKTETGDVVFASTNNCILIRQANPGE